MGSRGSAELKEQVIELHGAEVEISLKTRIFDSSALAWTLLVWSRAVREDDEAGEQDRHVRYLHLAHNEWDPARERAVLRVLLFTFGREDKLGRSQRGRRDVTATERVLFALVANRALAPSFKLAAADWSSHDVHIDGLAESGEQPCYRSMDWLHEVTDDLEKQVFDKVATC